MCLFVLDSRFSPTTLKWSPRSLHNEATKFPVNLLFWSLFLTSLGNSETQRLVLNVILKFEKINMVLVKPTMVKQP